MFLLQSELIRPMEEAFRSGSLAMSDQARLAGEAVGKAWGDYPLNWILVLASALVLALNLPNLFRIFPHVTRSFSRWRWNFTIEDSLQLSRTRDHVALCCFLPLCLLLSRYRVADPALFGRVDEGLRTLCVVALIGAWTGLRSLLHFALEARFAQGAALQVARKSGNNFLILLTFSLLALAGILYAFRVSDPVIRMWILLVGGAVYLLFLGVKAQILKSSCNPLTTFFYLCALEILPTGLLVAACLLL